MDGDTARLDRLELRLSLIEHRLDGLQAQLGDLVPASGSVQAAAPVAPEVPEPAFAAMAPPIAATPPAAPGLPPGPPRPVSEWPVHPAARMAPAGTPAIEPVATTQGLEPASAARATAPSRPASSLSLRDLEERFAGRALAWIGGLALVAAVVFFLSLAFSRGWITEPMRVLIGLGVGAASFAGGAVLLGRRSALVGNALAGVGLGILSISLMAATRLYNLIPAELGLVLALAMAAAAAIVAIRFDARSVAAFGLIATLAAPPLTGAAASTLTLLFVAVALVGTTAVALYRSWRWLPSIAFILAAPQLASWLFDDPPVWQALVALSGFWAVNLVAAAGEEVRVRRDDLRPSSSILVLANATFLLAGLFLVLDGALEGWRGLALALAAIAHLLAGLWFLVRQGWSHLFGNLVAGSGVALVAIATFVQLGAPAVPVAWAAEAVALGWLAARRVHPWSALAALALGGLAIGHLVFVEYPLYAFGLPSPDGAATWLQHTGAASLGGVLAALVVAIVLVPVRWVRSALAGVAVLLVAYTAPFEVAGNALTTVLTAATVVALAADRALERTRTPSRLAVVETWTRMPWASCTAPVAGVLALLVALPVGMPPGSWGGAGPAPVLEVPSISSVVIFLGLLAAGALVAVRWLRSGLVAIAILVIAWTAAFALHDTPLVAVLAVLLPIGVLADRGLARLTDGTRYPALTRARVPGRSASVTGAVAWALAGGCTVLVWPLDPWAPLPAMPFTDERTLAVALLIGSAVAATRWLGTGRPVAAARIASIAIAAWLVPCEVDAAWCVILWVALAGVALLFCERDRCARAGYGAAAALLWALAASAAVAVVAPPTHLWVGSEPVALAGPWMASFAMLAGGLAVAARTEVAHAARHLLLGGAGLIGLYAVSITVVDAFARRVGGGIPAEELAKQAQVALSVCWTAIGVTVLGIGLGRGVPMLRHAGFALLAAAIAKVVLIDMASMDVAYRALVLFGLGLLLLAGAWLLNRFQGPRTGTPDVPGHPHPA